MLNWQCYPQFAVYSEGHNTKRMCEIAVYRAVCAEGIPFMRCSG